MHFVRRIVGIGGVVVFSLLSVAAFAAFSLDGTAWRVEITPEGATVPYHIDILRFEGGSLSSVIFQRKGFENASYSLTNKGGGVAAWESKQKSNIEGTLVWQGEIEGSAMKGALVWEKADGSVVKHALLGSPAVEEPATAPTEEAAEAVAPGAKASVPKVAKAKKGFFGCSLLR